MTQIHFDKEFSDEHKAIRFLFWFQLATFFILGFLYLLAKDSLHGLILSISLIALITFLGVVGYLYWKFASTPQGKQKKKLSKQLAKFKQRLRATEARIRNTKDTRGRITKDEEVAIRRRHAQHQRLLIEYKERRIHLDSTEQGELASKLKNLQSLHLKNGLEATTIEGAKIQGVGPKLKQRLFTSGITKAKDVSFSRVAQVRNVSMI